MQVLEDCGRKKKKGKKKGKKETLSALQYDEKSLVHLHSTESGEAKVLGAHDDLCNRRRRSWASHVAAVQDPATPDWTTDDGKYTRFLVFQIQYEKPIKDSS